jgi:hypothetical protein
MEPCSARSAAKRDARKVTEDRLEVPTLAGLRGAPRSGQLLLLRCLGFRPEQHRDSAANGYDLAPLLGTSDFEIRSEVECQGHGA